MLARSLSRILIVTLAITLVGVVPLLDQQTSRSAPVAEAALSCTFTAKYPAVNLRSGAGIEYDKVGTLANGETLAVIDQAAGNDGMVWWKSAEGWVRSDMGTSDCPSTCGNTVCEYGENSTSCAKDCGSTAAAQSTTTTTTNLTSTGEGCYVSDCQSCYESISCYPTCNVCDCWKNAFGCVTCFCQEPTTTSTGCVFATCDECIAAFPCSPGPCTKTECTLNEYGCPVCSTSG
jgi:hypothetical protein